MVRCLDASRQLIVSCRRAYQRTTENGLSGEAVEAAVRQATRRQRIGLSD